VKTALVTTTIHVPRVLELYKACDPTVKMYVAGDRNTPREAYEETLRIGGSVCLPESGHQWKCSELIGWKTISRRNIAFLHALKAGAELVVSIDDDNAPINLDYFWNYETRLTRPFGGLCASSKSGWFDAGQLLVPWAKHRGIPHAYHHHVYAPIVKAKIGVMAGLVLGDSDVDATTRLETPLGVATMLVSELAKAGVVVDLNTHTVFNSQNTAVIRELVPAWFMMPGVGRMDDIYASLIVQRVAKERELHVHFGKPFVHQQRNEHDLIKDLRAEIDGYEHVRSMATLLDQIVLRGKSVIEDTRTIYQTLLGCSFLPRASVEAGLAYLEDCESLGL